MPRFREIPPSLKHEIKVAGLESARALFASRPRDITRVYVIERMQREVSDILAWCDAEDVPWYEVTIEELAAFTETMRHDGVCLVARKKQPLMAANLASRLVRHRGPLAMVLLDGVKNPNNVGAVARACAYFGTCSPPVSHPVFRKPRCGSPKAPPKPSSTCRCVISAVTYPLSRTTTSSW